MPSTRSRPSSMPNTPRGGHSPSSNRINKKRKVAAAVASPPMQNEIVQTPSTPVRSDATAAPNTTLATPTPTAGEDTDAESEGETMELYAGSVYLEDGNILIKAEKTLFRVHRSQLASHSTILRDYIAACLARSPLIHEGCPILQVSDTAADVQALLEILYSMKNLESEKFTFVASVLRLATKYNVSTVRERATRIFSLAYPRTLAEWDSFDGTRPCPVQVLTVATAASSILPSALYALVQYTYGEMEDAGATLHNYKFHVSARERLTPIWSNFLQSEWVSKAAPCTCAGFPKFHPMSLITSPYTIHPNLRETTSTDPLKALKEYLERLESSRMICPHRKDEVRGRVEAVRAAVWNDLPQHVGLGNEATWADFMA